MDKTKTQSSRTGGRKGELREEREGSAKGNNLQPLQQKIEERELQ